MIPVSKVTIIFLPDNISATGEDREKEAAPYPPSQIQIKHTLAHPASETSSKWRQHKEKCFSKSEKVMRMRRNRKIPVVLFLSAAKFVQRERGNV